MSGGQYSTLRHRRLIPDPAGHRAVEAWRRLGLGGAVGSVEVLKEDKPKKSRVYRLIDVGTDRRSIIAKRCRPATARVEQRVYEQVLPRLPLSQLRCYGAVEDPDPANHWLFLEDAGDVQIETDELVDVVQWLGCFHTHVSSAVTPSQFPDRGLDYHRQLLHAARQRLLQGLEGNGFSGESRRLLRGTLDLLDRADRRWEDVEARYAAMPKTLIHGDLVCKNVRVRPGLLGRELCVLDWEQAGWGLPGQDLVTLARVHADLPGRSLLESYQQAVRPVWRCTVEELESASHVGMVFRSIARTAIEAHSISIGPACWLIERMRVTEQGFRKAAGLLGWSGGGGDDWSDERRAMAKQ